MHSDKFYNINYRRLSVMLLPVCLRKETLSGFVSVMASAISAVQTSFALYRSDRLADLRVTGQVCILRSALNDRWDEEQRRIEITDGVTGQPLMVYRRGAYDRTYAYARGSSLVAWAYRRGMTSGGTGFIVKVPAEVYADAAKLTALTFFVDTHRLVGMTPLIMSN